MSDSTNQMDTSPVSTDIPLNRRSRSLSPLSDTFEPPSKILRESIPDPEIHQVDDEEDKDEEPTNTQPSKPVPRIPNATPNVLPQPPNRPPPLLIAGLPTRFLNYCRNFQYTCSLFKSHFDFPPTHSSVTPRQELFLLFATTSQARAVASKHDILARIAKTNATSIKIKMLTDPPKKRVLLLSGFHPTHDKKSLEDTIPTLIHTDGSPADIHITALHLLISPKTKKFYGKVRITLKDNTKHAPLITAARLTEPITGRTIHIQDWISKPEFALCTKCHRSGHRRNRCTEMQDLCPVCLSPNTDPAHACNNTPCRHCKQTTHASNNTFLCPVLIKMRTQARAYANARKSTIPTTLRKIHHNNSRKPYPRKAQTHVMRTEGTGNNPLTITNRSARGRTRTRRPQKQQLNKIPQKPQIQTRNQIPNHASTHSPSNTETHQLILELKEEVKYQAETINDLRANVSILTQLVRELVAQSETHNHPHTPNATLNHNQTDTAPTQTKRQYSDVVQTRTTPTTNPPTQNKRKTPSETPPSTPPSNPNKKPQTSNTKQQTITKQSRKTPINASQLPQPQMQPKETHEKPTSATQTQTLPQIPLRTNAKTPSSQPRNPESSQIITQPTNSSDETNNSKTQRSHSVSPASTAPRTKLRNQTVLAMDVSLSDSDTETSSTKEQ